MSFNFKKLSISSVLIASTMLSTLSVNANSNTRSEISKPKASIKMTYEVKSGDTLSEIAETYFGTAEFVEEIAKINKIENPNLIEVGQKLDFKGVKELGKDHIKSETQTTQVQQNSTSYSTNYQVSYSQAPSYSYAAPAAGNVVLSNGNTAGEIGLYAAQRMADATGVPASTWEYIIARESGGNPHAYNASGASGLFQTIPGWGSTATVEDQISTALNAYNAQGLSAWGY